MAKLLDDGIHTDVIYLDMAKAFDKVPHEKLLYKLYIFGVRDPCTLGMVKELSC